MELVFERGRGEALGQGLVELARRAAGAGGRALAVGGCVRDALLGRPAQDVDVEIFGLEPDALGRILSGPLAANRVGRAFPIFRLARLAIDVSVPVDDAGHWDRTATPETAALRRDFTCNAMALDPLTGELIDPLAGRADLDARRLRHASDRFSEDPLRVLRGMQLIARFELEPASSTVDLCRGLRGAALPKERIFGEWRQLLLRGIAIGSGLRFLQATGWLHDLPELEALVDCPQDPHWHPEGCVWTHTGHCLDVFARERIDDEREDLIVGLAVLCHDLGKPATTQTRDGRWISHGHDRAGVAPGEALLARLTDETALVTEVLPLVREHLAPVQLHRAQAGPAAIRRLARRVGRIDRLVRVARADQHGRPPLPTDGFPAGDWLLERARSLGVEHAPPIPFVRGRDLVERGEEPGPSFGPVLERCYEAQIEGRVSSREEALKLLESVLARSRGRNR